MLRVAHCKQNGHQIILIHTVDTYVVVLAIATVQHQSTSKLWVAFGDKQHFRYIPAHTIAHRLATRKCQALPVSHAITGCDTVSSFCRRGKQSAWDAWMSYPAVNKAFINLTVMPERESNQCSAGGDGGICCCTTHQSLSTEKGELCKKTAILTTFLRTLGNHIGHL